MKNKKPLIITLSTFLAIALATFLLCGFLYGWDFKAFLESPAFVWILVLLGVYIVIVVVFFIKDYIRKL